MKNTLNRFSAFFKNSSLFVRALIVVSVVGVVAGTATVAAMVATPNEDKPRPTTTEAKTSDDKEPAPVANNEKPDETVPTQTTQNNQQATPQQPTPTPVEPPKDDNAVTVEDIPKDLFGFSEYHAYKRRIEVGKPDAIKGVAAGYLFANIYCNQHNNGTTSSKYAIACLPGGQRGHMAFVEEVQDNGDIRVTEMNYTGWNTVSERIIPKDQAANYRYIP